MLALCCVHRFFVKITKHLVKMLRDNYDELLVFVSHVCLC